MGDGTETGDAAPSVTFETKVWEGDYRVVLTEERLSAALDRNCFEFARRVVHVNNVDNRRAVERRARSVVAAGLVDDVVFVEDHAASALDHFGLTVTDLGRGYVYSISELVSIYLATTDHVLHFAGDTILSQEYNWLPDALDLLRRRPDVAVVNLSWTSDITAVEAESEDRDGDFLLGYGFSDQMYLVRTSDFSAQIYGESHPASDRYPDYGGELFEKRVDSWMRNHSRLRATWTDGYYAHENIRAPGLKNRLRGSWFMPGGGR
ncbi:hypothetical protein [Nocardioides baculatus]|uniref:Glycosyltransferase n=1 Tax=Nocardioides baculatus TaxID=2801337 RepID=A0ABS1LBR3_9ACTN|nr:hypothetical protein [Nocardioides baculatus]MBL0749131.1 hypothetical protein [Nocardioides baculatus]